MESQRLDRMIDDLESMFRNATSLLAPEPVDWRPLFAKAKDIQGGFNSRVQYPTKHERDAAWVRFNDLRTQVFERANAQRSAFRSKSEYLRDQILNHIKFAGYSKVVDVIFFFDPTTVEDMKRANETLREGGQMLSRNKHLMLKEHKDECFARIQELRQEHEEFWEKYREQKAAKRQEYLDRKAAYERRGAEIAYRIRSNIAANHEKLEKAKAAYARVRVNLEQNMEKLESARSPGFAERVAGWIDDDKDKLRSIAESIERIRSWIDEDEARLNDLLNRK